MLSRPAHRRFAFLALLAAMLVLVMPTLAQLRAPAMAQSATRMHVLADTTPGMAGQDALAGGHDHREAQGGDCAYCPLLAGLLHWNAAPPTAPYADAERLASTLNERAAYARTWPGTLGSRGPPATRAV